MIYDAWRERNDVDDQPPERCPVCGESLEECSGHVTYMDSLAESPEGSGWVALPEHWTRNPYAVLLSARCVTMVKKVLNEMEGVTR